MQGSKLNETIFLGLCLSACGCGGGVISACGCPLHVRHPEILDRKQGNDPPPPPKQIMLAGFLSKSMRLSPAAARFPRGQNTALARAWADMENTHTGNTSSCSHLGCYRSVTRVSFLGSPSDHHGIIVGASWCNHKVWHAWDMTGSCLGHGIMDSDSTTRGFFSDSASAPVAASGVSWARVAANCTSDRFPKCDQIHGNLVDLFDLIELVNLPAWPTN